MNIGMLCRNIGLKFGMSNLALRLDSHKLTICVTFWARTRRIKIKFNGKLCAKWQCKGKELGAVMRAFRSNISEDWHITTPFSKDHFITFLSRNETLQLFEIIMVQQVSLAPISSEHFMISEACLKHFVGS